MFDAFYTCSYNQLFSNIFCVFIAEKFARGTQEDAHECMSHIIDSCEVL